MGAWGHGFCESDADLDLLARIGADLGLPLSPGSDAEAAELRAALPARLDAIVARHDVHEGGARPDADEECTRSDDAHGAYASAAGQRPFRCAWRDALLLVLFVAPKHGVRMSEEARAVGRRRLEVCWDQGKRRRLGEMLAAERTEEVAEGAGGSSAMGAAKGVGSAGVQSLG